MLTNKGIIDIITIKLLFTTNNAERRKIMGVASLILGIVSLVCSLFGAFSWIGCIAGIIGIILGAMARKQAASGVATGGLVCSIIGLVLCAIVFIACAACVGAFGTLGALQ